MPVDYLEVEFLQCENPKYHKNCEWVHAHIRYPSNLFLPLKNQLISEVKRTGIAYRIVHWKFGTLVTIKRGHDNSIYVGEDKETLKHFALY